MTVYYQLAKHVSFTQIEDEAVLLDLNSGQYFGLNHVGVKLIEAFNNGDDRNTAEKSISNHYSVGLEQVKDDVSILLSDMLDKKLLRQICYPLNGPSEQSRAFKAG